MYITQQQNVSSFMRQTYILSVKCGINDALSAYLIINQMIMGRDSFEVKYFALLM